MHFQYPHSRNSGDYPVHVAWAMPDAGSEWRPRNIFGRPKATSDPETNEAFLAGGKIDPSGAVKRNELRDLMLALETRMWQTPRLESDLGSGMLWKSNLPGADDPLHNPNLPSGYTYLLQLIAHDLVDSVRSATVGQDGRATPDFFSARMRPLTLETIYGSGPDGMPHAYDLADATDVAPRTRLRLGTLRDSNIPAHRVFCPFRDIARTTPGSAFEVSGQGEGAVRYSETLIADPRNDAHALISQLTVLFHLLHNAVLDALPRGRSAVPERIYRRFLCARFVVTLIYRNLIANDLLPRILDRGVLDVYRGNPTLHLGECAMPPLEFVAGAFRFAHSMVRRSYHPNSKSRDVGQDIARALNQSARRDRTNVPVTSTWAVDWALFFGGDSPANLSRRIGPYYAGQLMEEEAKRAGGDFEEFINVGLPTRDFLSGAYMGLWSIPALHREIKRRSPQLAYVLPDYAVWREPLEGWLLAGMGEEDVAAIVEDPPLLFFILFEAAHELGNDRRRPLPAEALSAERPELVFPGHGGQRLGPLGSILVADTFFPALRNPVFGFYEWEFTLAERIKKVSEALLGDTEAMNRVILDSSGRPRSLDTMPDLLALMQELGAFE